MKKKLLFSNVANQWNSLVTKFLRLHKRIQSPGFTENYSEQQQKYLLSKLQRLFNRLDRMQYQVGIKIAGTALFLMLASTTAFAQQNWRQIGDDHLGKLPYQGISLSNNFTKMAFADLDGDGYLDLYCAGRIGEGGNGRPSYIMKYTNDGSGNFPDAGKALMADGDTIKFAKYISIAFADLDGDADLDLYIGDQASGTIKFFINQGLGVFSAASNLQADGVDVNLYWVNPAFADLDHDGDLDLFIGGQPGKVAAFTNNNGVFTSAGFLQLENGDTLLVTGLNGNHQYSAPAFADMDRDGHLDLYLGGNRSNINWFENIGSGTFGPFRPFKDLMYADSTSIPLNCGDYVNPVFADVDGDGTQELWASDMLSNVYHFQYVSTTGITENSIQKFVMYPNPVSNELRIENAGSINRIEITNALGQSIKTIKLRSENETISVSDFSPGVYFVKFMNVNKLVGTQKFIKK